MTRVLFSYFYDDVSDAGSVSAAEALLDSCCIPEKLHTEVTHLYIMQ